MSGSAIIDIDDSVNQAASGQELEFQTFTFNESSPSKDKGKYNKISATPPPGAEWDAPSNTPAVDPSSSSNPSSSSPSSSNNQHPFYRLEYYKQFFDVDSDQVLKRMLSSLMFWKGDFAQSLSPSPDLYGPFWIATTVVFILFVTGNISGSIIANINGKTYVPDFKMLSLASSAIYSYVFLGSLALWGVCRYYQVPLSFLEIVCLYGYAMFIFIPISVICVIPLDAVKWSFSMAAFLVSGLFITMNLWPAASSKNKGLAMAICGGVLVCHLGLTLLFKFVFFSYKNVQIDL